MVRLISSVIDFFTLCWGWPFVDIIVRSNATYHIEKCYLIHFYPTRPTWTKEKKKKKFKKNSHATVSASLNKAAGEFFFFLKSLSCQTLSLLAKKFHFSPEKLSLFSRKISPSPELSLF